jgi:hypothetical protein
MPLDLKPESVQTFGIILLDKTQSRQFGPGKAKHFVGRFEWSVGGRVPWSDP